MDGGIKLVENEMYSAGKVGQEVEQGYGSNVADTLEVSGGMAKWAGRRSPSSTEGMLESLS